MKLRLLPCLLIALGCLEVHAQNDSTFIGFDEAVRRAGGNQPLVLKAEALVQSAQARSGETSADFLPQLDAEAGYAYVQPTQSLNFGGQSLETVPANLYGFHLKAGFLVYDFGRRELKIRMAQGGVDAALLNLETVRQGLAYRTASLYYQALFLKARISVLDDYLDRLKAHLDLAAKREAEGKAIHLEALATQISIDKIRIQRVELASSLEKAYLSLRQLIGLPQGEAYEIGGSWPEFAEERSDQGLVALALAQRPEMQAALKAERSQSLAASLARLSGYPSLSAQAFLGYRDGLLSSSSQNDTTLSLEWGLGLSLSMPVFDGFRGEKAGEETESQAEALHQDSEALRRDIGSQVLASLQDLKASQAQLALSQARSGEAQEALGLAATQYDLSAGTNKDYLDSLDLYAEAKIGEFQARYAKALSGLGLHQALGDPVPAANLASESPAKP